MCQKSAGESEYMLARDKYIRSKGYKAFKEGVAREQCPELEHELEHYSDAHQWRMGWDMAKAGNTVW